MVLFILLLYIPLQIKHMPDLTSPTLKEYLGMFLHRLCLTTHGIYLLLETIHILDGSVDCFWLNSKGTVIKRKYYKI